VLNGACRVLYGLWSVPHKDGAFAADGHDKLAIRGNGDLLDSSGVADTLEVADTFVVAPDFHDLVLASGHKVLSLSCNGKSVQLSRCGSIEHADSLSIKAVPVCHLSVGTGRDQLRFVGVVND